MNSNVVDDMLKDISNSMNGASQFFDLVDCDEGRKLELGGYKDALSYQVARGDWGKNRMMIVQRKADRTEIVETIPRVGRGNINWA